MFYTRVALFAIYIFLCCSVPVLAHLADGDPCVSLVDSPFKICRNAGYDQTTPFPEHITEARKREFAIENVRYINSTRNCAARGLAEAIECSFLAPKCNSLGDPIYPCRQVCAEYLKQCEFELNDLEFLISYCLVLPNGSSSCAPCFAPPNFTTNENETGPLDRGCEELIIPACKNLGLYNYTLSSIIAQEDQYYWFYQKNFTADNLETEFPDFAQDMFELYPKCQENIKKLFCGQHFPPCFPHEGLRLYTLCKPLCDAIARDCPEFFRHNLPGAEYCATMAKGKSEHGFCQSTKMPEEFSWLDYAEATKSPRVTTKALTTIASAKTKEIKDWAIIVTVLLSMVVVGIVVWIVFCWKMRHIPTPAYSKQYKRQTNVDMHPVETQEV